MNRDAQRGARFKEERERFTFSQQAAADLVGVRREMWAKWEAGAEPGGDALTRCIAAGFDVLYILTGQRVQPIAARPLAPDVEALVDNYLNTPEEKRGAIREVSAAFAQRSRRRSA